MLGYKMYSQYAVVKASDCLVLPDDASPKEAAALWVNPMTAYGIVETMKREGRRALVQTAGASNVGQMVNRMCGKEGIPLVNVVRNTDQVTLLE